MMFQCFSSALFIEKIYHFREQWRSRSSVVQHLQSRLRGGGQHSSIFVCDFRECGALFRGGWQSRSQTQLGGSPIRAGGKPAEKHKRYRELVTQSLTRCWPRVSANCCSFSCDCSIFSEKRVDISWKAGDFSAHVVSVSQRKSNI